MPTKIMNNVDPIVLRLRALAQNSPDLKNAAELYEAILPVLRDADLHVGALLLTADQVREKMEHGLPLLRDQNLELDVEAAQDLMLRLARAVESIPGMTESNDALRKEAARRIRMALEENALDMHSLLSHIAAGEHELAACAAQGIELDPGLVLVLAQNALKPALRAWRLQLTPLAEGIEWHKGSCFVCGAVASLGELQGNNQTTHLRCGQCGADWLFRRLRCLYCGNEDHDTLRCLYPEKEAGKMRIEACDQCKGYLKVIAAFDPTPAEMLAVEDLATLHLDYIAQERGYSRRTVR